jgi:hypothetical protein
MGKCIQGMTHWGYLARDPSLSLSLLERPKTEQNASVNDAHLSLLERASACPRLLCGLRDYQAPLLRAAAGGAYCSETYFGACDQKRKAEALGFVESFLNYFFCLRKQAKTEQSFTPLDSCNAVSARGSRELTCRHARFRFP